MGWFTKKTSGNELGEYLPDDEAQITEKSERLQANSQPEADKKCEEIASEYGGMEASAKPVGKSWFDCTFKVWE